MTMFLTRSPMTKGQFDLALAGIGWRRDGEEAYDASSPKRRFICDIDKVPSADGSKRIMFDNRVAGCGRLLEAVDCIAETDPAFWRALGIRIETDDSADDSGV